MRTFCVTMCVLVVGLSFSVQNAEAQLFQQNFTNTFAPLQGNSSTVPLYLSDPNYVSATPSNSQFTHICATSGGTPATQYMLVYDSVGVLSMSRIGGGNGALIRNIPFAGPPASMLVKLEFNVTDYRGGSAGNNYVNFNVGTSFDTLAGRPSGGFAKFGIGFAKVTGGTNFWFVNNINSGTVSSTNQNTEQKPIWFAVNNSGGTLTYTSPTGASEAVANQTWDLWVGTTKEFDDQPANDPTQTLSAFKIVYGSASSTVIFDNITITPLVTSGVNGNPTVPRSTRLAQNYPNPFNPSTVIEYQLAERSPVRIALYDIIGNEVQLLLNREQSAGTYKLNVDASNLSSGIYFYRIQAGAFTQTRKMILSR